jgi:3',5'-cyclic-AMP phosphodiesterase
MSKIITSYRSNRKKKSIIIPMLFTMIFLIACNARNTVKTIKIGMCSDVHLPTMHDSEYRINTFIDSMKIAKPDFIIELGDFGIPKPEYAKYFEIWNSFPGPKYHVIGNHEMDGGTSLAQALDYRNMESSYYQFKQNGFQFIVLDGNDKKDPNQSGYRKYIGPKQQAWLQDELKIAAGPVVIFSHQGIGPVEGLENHEDIRAILEQHNKKSKSNRVIACFNGHAHNDSAEEINGIWYIHINSMSYKWLGEEYEHIRYSKEVDKNFKWIKYTAPYKDPLFAVVEISSAGYIKIKGKESEWVGPSPWEVGYPEEHKSYTVPKISSRELHFEPF